MNDPQIIILLGPPGAGKGTQASLLSDELSLYHWETSRIVGRIIDRAKEGDFLIADGKKYYFSEEKKLRESGILWDPPFLIQCIKGKIEELAKENEGIIISGSPRTLYEAENLLSILEKLYGKENIQVVIIKLSAEQTILRNSHRRECSLMRHPILFTKETVNLTRCPLDGSRLVTRKDDDPETIKRRLKEYEKRTFPVVDYLKNEGLRIIEVDGDQSVESLFKIIINKLNKKYIK